MGVYPLPWFTWTIEELTGIRFEHEVYLIRPGWEPTMDYLCDESHLRWKIRQVGRVVEQELAMYRKALAYNQP